MSNESYTNTPETDEVSTRPVKIGVDAATAALLVKSVDAGALPIPTYDAIALTYVAVGNGIGEIETATYKLAGATVGVVTYTYDASDRVATIVLS
jgi:hypothetical protein